MFQDREEAGRLLAEKLNSFANRKNVIVVGLPRGGVVTAKTVAKTLNLPLDIIVVKKIGAPFNPELAIGAVGPEKTLYWDRELIKRTGIDKRITMNELRIKEKERKEREMLLKGKRKTVTLRNKTVILVDDGIATGATALVAAEYLRKKHVADIILAIPVIPKDTIEIISRYFDRVISLVVSQDFSSVGSFYASFPQVSDFEVISFLEHDIIQT